MPRPPPAGGACAHSATAANAIANVTFREADVFEVLAGYASARREFSTVVLDPLVAQFKTDNERLPEKLLDLVTRPGYPTKKWPDGGYLKLMPRDGFDSFLVYRVPGTGGEAYDLVSYGADGVEGGADENEDLWNHDKRPAKKEEPKKDGQK